VELSECQFASGRADTISQGSIFCYKLDFGSEIFFIVRSGNEGVFAVRKVSRDFADAVCNDRPSGS
jgi:hypothetical protein